MTGIVLLVGIMILIFLGLAQTVLDKLYLSDRGGLIFVGAIVLGSFIDIPLWRDPQVSINVGGAILPIALAIYVLVKAGTAKEWIRAIIGIFLTAGLLYGINKFYRFDINQGFMEPQYLWGIVAGIVAYIAGRSRRLSFIIATLGILSLDIAHIIEANRSGYNVPTQIGGAGFFDTIFIAGILAVLLAEIIGEGREALQGGPATTNRPEKLEESLEKPDAE